LEVLHAKLLCIRSQTLNPFSILHVFSLLGLSLFSFIPSLSPSLVVAVSLCLLSWLKINSQGKEPGATGEPER
jgi:hypothetical protein